MPDETVEVETPHFNADGSGDARPAGELGTAQQRRRREPKVITPRGTPVCKVPVVLNTEFAQRVYWRTWDRLKADLYILTIRTRTAEQMEAAAAIEAIISEAFDKARTDLAADMERTEVLRDHVKVRELPEYDDRLDTTATYSTPRAREFLGLIQQMDQLLVLYDALWLTGFVDTQERLSRSQNWQRRLTKVTNRLRELANRTRGQLVRQADRMPGDEAAQGQGDGVAGETVQRGDGSVTGEPRQGGEDNGGAAEGRESDSAVSNGVHDEGSEPDIRPLGTVTELAGGVARRMEPEARHSVAQESFG